MEELPLTDEHGAGLLVTARSREAVRGLRFGLELRLYDERPFLFLRLEAANEGPERLLLPGVKPIPVAVATRGRTLLSWELRSSPLGE